MRFEAYEVQLHQIEMGNGPYVLDMDVPEGADVQIFEPHIIRDGLVSALVVVKIPDDA